MLACLKLLSGLRGICPPLYCEKGCYEIIVAGIRRMCVEEGGCSLVLGIKGPSLVTCRAL